MNIKCENLSIGYNKKPIVENINFELSHGDFLCIVGENASGKSTLIQTILGLTEAVSGNITFNASNVMPRIGYLQQAIMIPSDFPATVKEVVYSGLLNSSRLLNFYSSKQNNKAKSMMEKTGIWTIRNKSFNQLSGGQKQRVLLAKALVATDTMLFVDEPLNGLDINIRKELNQLLKELNQSGLTIVMISHDFEQIMACASHILFLQNGKADYYLKEDFRLDFIHKNSRDEVKEYGR